MDRLKSLVRKIDRLPPDPGVYLFKDPGGRILYVGKAANLRYRVRSYFKRPVGDLKTLTMMEQVADLETLVTNNEKEALILEDNLIKEHHPRYNVKLRDDKNYPCLRLSREEEFPVLSFVRGIRKDGALYFGPYPSARPLRETLKLRPAEGIAGILRERGPNQRGEHEGIGRGPRDDRPGGPGGIRFLSPAAVGRSSPPGI